MAARAEIEAGVCGFRTTAQADCEGEQYVRLTIQTDCPRVRKLAEALGDGRLDAFAEVGGDSRLLATARRHLTGCCAGCVVPNGLFKVMQVAAGLALPRDIHLRLSHQAPPA